MWTESGHVAHLTFAGVRKGGSDDSSKFTSRPLVLTDPVNGKTFTQETNPYLFGMNTNPRSAQDMLNEEIAQRQAEEKAASDAAAKTAADKAAADRAAFVTSRDTAANNARTGALSFLTSRGVNADQIGDRLNNAISTSLGNVADLSPNPSASFDPNLGQSIYNDITSAGRTKATASLNDLFSPTFSSDRITSASTDPLINDILNEQFNPLSTSLQFARDRGQLSPSGFAAATDLLGTKRTAAEGTVRGLANSAITKDRTDIDNLITGAKNTAGSLTPDQFATFNPNSFRTQADDLITRDLSSLGGDIRNSVGQTKFADLNDLLTAGGSASGPTQTPATGADTPTGAFGGDASDPTAALAEQARRNAARRGLGSQGAF